MAHTIELICLGDELLDGTIADRNIHFFGDFVSSHGSALAAARIAPDNFLSILGALDDSRGSIVVVSGGLGPTADDLTRDAAALWSGVELQCDEAILGALKRRFSSRGSTFTANNAKQAHFPDGALILPSEVGTAAGFRIDRGDATYFFFPGVPSEFRWFCATYVAPELGSSVRRIDRLHFHGLGESQLETHLNGIEDRARDLGVKVGYRAEYPIIEVKLVGPPDGCDTLRSFVMQRIAPFFVGDDAGSLPARVGALLRERGESLATAESCTAGMIAAAITDVAGSSDYFGYGFVSYANDAKYELLGVSPVTLERFGAVSAQVVAQMAHGARCRAGSDWAIAVSGIAGPGGGTSEKPVGTVDFAIAHTSGVWVRRVLFPVRTRERIRQGTVFGALAMLTWLLEGTLDVHQDVRGPFSPREVTDDLGIPSESDS